MQPRPSALEKVMNLPDDVVESLGLLLFHCGLAATYIYSFLLAYWEGRLTHKAYQFLTIWMVACNTLYFCTATIRDALDLYRAGKRVAHQRGEHSRTRKPRGTRGRQSGRPPVLASLDSSTSSTGADHPADQGNNAEDKAAPRQTLRHVLYRVCSRALLPVMSLSVGACALFWVLCFIDQELVLPTALNYPPLLNHLQHTLPLVTALAEPLLLFHPRDVPPSFSADCAASTGLVLLYTALIGIRGCVLDLGFPYPFMRGWTPAQFALFAAPAALLASIVPPLSTSNIIKPNTEAKPVRESFALVATQIRDKLKYVPIPKANAPPPQNQAIAPQPKTQTQQPLFTKVSHPGMTMSDIGVQAYVPMTAQELGQSIDYAQLRRMVFDDLHTKSTAPSSVIPPSMNAALRTEHPCMTSAQTITNDLFQAHLSHIRQTSQYSFARYQQETTRPFDHRYTTLEDTLEYIRARRKQVLTFEQAKALVDLDEKCGM